MKIVVRHFMESIYRNSKGWRRSFIFKNIGKNGQWGNLDDQESKSNAGFEEGACKVSKKGEGIGEGRGRGKNEKFTGFVPTSMTRWCWDRFTFHRKGGKPALQLFITRILGFMGSMMSPEIHEVESACN